MQQIIDRLAATGFTDDEIEYFRSQGLVDEEIEALRADGASATVPTVLVGRTMGEVVEETVAGLELSSVATLDALRGSSSIRAAEAYHGARANDASFDVLVDTPTPITLSGDDPDGDLLRFTVTGEPAHGTLTGEAPDLVYTPDAGYPGPDSFTFVADDGTGPSLPATVSVSVALPPPDPQPTVRRAPGRDAVGSRSGRAAQRCEPTPPAHRERWSAAAGLTAFRPDGSFEFTAPTDVVGPVTFTYRARFAGSVDSPPVTVTIDVVNREDRPSRSMTSWSSPRTRWRPSGPRPTTPTPTATRSSSSASDSPPTGGSRVGSMPSAHIARMPTSPAATPPSTRSTTGRDASWRPRLTFVVGPVADPPRPVADRLSFDKGFAAAIDVLANDSHPDARNSSSSPTRRRRADRSVCEPSGSCTYTPLAARSWPTASRTRVRDAEGRESTATVTVAAFAAFEEIASDGPLLVHRHGRLAELRGGVQGDALGSFFADFGCGTFAARRHPVRAGPSPAAATRRNRATSRAALRARSAAHFDDPSRSRRGPHRRQRSRDHPDRPYVRARSRTAPTSPREHRPAAGRSRVPRRRLPARRLRHRPRPDRSVDRRGAACAPNGRIIEWHPLTAASSTRSRPPTRCGTRSRRRSRSTVRAAAPRTSTTGAGSAGRSRSPPGGANGVPPHGVLAVRRTPRFRPRPSPTTPCPHPAPTTATRSTVSNPNPTTPVTARELTVTFPAGFSYVAGSTRERPPASRAPTGGS